MAFQHAPNVTLSPAVHRAPVIDMPRRSNTAAGIGSMRLKGRVACAIGAFFRSLSCHEQAFPVEKVLLVPQSRIGNLQCSAAPAHCQIGRNLWEPLARIGFPPPSPRFDPFGTLKRDRRGGSVLAQHFAEKPTLPPGEPDRHTEARRQSADVTMHRGPIHERFATINIVMPEFDPVRIGARIKKRTQRRHAILSAAERHDNPCVLVEIRHHDRNLAADAPVMIRRLLSAPGTGVIERRSGFWWRPSHVNRSQGYRIPAFTASLS